MSHVNAAGQRLPMGRWMILAIICIPVFVGSLDLTVVSAFLPKLLQQLEIPPQTGTDDAAWILSAYLLAYSVSLTFMGRASDLLGRRWVYAICLLTFIAGSVFVAVADGWPTQVLYDLYRQAGSRPDIAYVNLQAIIIGRVIQAIGAGALVPVSMALVADMFPPEQRAQPLGLVGAIDTLGWVLGSLYGGIFIQFMPWQGLFWINVPLTLFALGMTLWVLRNMPQQRSGGRFDVIGAALIAGALTALNLGLGANIDIGGTTSSFQELSPLPPYAAPVLMGGALLLLLFILVESRVKYPLINLKLFQQRNASMGALTNLFVGYCLFIGLVTVPILVNVREVEALTLEQAALQVGLMLSALTVPMALATIPGGWLSERLGYSRVVVGGLSLATLGFVLIWQTWDFEVANGVVIAEMILIGTGIGLTFSPISAAVINSAGDADRGVASALVLVLRLVGMSVSVSTISAAATQRVNLLADPIIAVRGFDYALEIYSQVTVDVLAELGLVGAFFCLIAMLPASQLRGGRHTPQLNQRATSEIGSAASIPSNS